jgi:hypothetical protein
MKRATALIASLGVALAAVAGVFALGSTLSLSGNAHRAQDSQIARRTAQLDRYQASLTRALAQKPPALPPVPAASTTASAGALAAPARVVYHRPPPIVVVTHRGGDHEDEHEQEVEGVGWDD